MSKDNNIFDNYAELVAKFKDGDVSAYDELYEKTQRMVYAICLGILDNEDDAFDIMQDTYLHVYNKLHTLQDNKAFISWLKKIASNKALDLCRKRKRIVSYDDAVAVDESLQLDDDLESLPDSYIMEKTKREALNKIIKESLTDVQYQTVHMHYYTELSVEEIAEIMECPEGTVKTRLKASRGKIKEGVKKYEKDNKDAFAATPAVPFLTRFFQAASEDLTVPQIDISSLIGKDAGLSSAVSDSAANASKEMLKNPELADKGIKIVGGVLAAAMLIGGGIAVKKQFDKAKSETVEASVAVVSETTVPTETTQSVEIVDPFSYINVIFGGHVPDEGTVSISRYSSCPEEFQFEISRTTGLNNGDEVTVNVVSTPETEGVEYSPLSCTFVVEGLSRDVSVIHSENTVPFYDYGYATLQVSVPEVSISGHDMTEVNNALYEACMPEIAMPFTQYSPVDGHITSSDYNYQYLDFLSYVTDDTISIVLVCTDLGKDHVGPMYTFKVYNISVETGELLDDEALLDIIGMDMDDFHDYVVETLTNDVTEMNIANEEQIEELESMVGMSQVEFNTLDERVATARPYINSYGELCFVYETAFVPSEMAPYPYYFTYRCIDPSDSQYLVVQTTYVNDDYNNPVEGFLYNWYTYR